VTLILAGVYARQSLVTPLKRDFLYWLNFTCPISRASSASRCNTMECIDSTLLARKNQLFGCTRSDPSRSSVPAGLTLASDFGFCFQCQAGSSLLLRRPIEITRVVGNLNLHIRLRR
jgi:hypothetical protein